MSYNHLSLEERHCINTALKKGISLSQIAKYFERSQSIISREVNRNKGQRGYRYQQANSKALQRHKDKYKRVKLTSEITNSIDKCLRQQSSPEQIVGWLASDGIIKLHHETVYPIFRITKSFM